MSDSAAKTETFLFFRPEGFYPVDIRPADLADNVRLNPGTIRVETLAGRVVWRAGQGAPGPEMTQ